jgi:hypothetical protein
MLNKNDQPFSNKYGGIAETVLTHYLSIEDFVNTSIEDLVSFVSVKSRGRIADTVETANY